MATYVLLITSPDNRVQTLELDKSTATVGREAGDIIVSDPRCSSRHAQIDFNGHEVRIRDLASTNGTFYRSERITEMLWPVHATLQIGKYQLSLQEIRATAAQTMVAGQTKYASARTANGDTASSGLAAVTAKLRSWGATSTARVVLALSAVCFLGGALGWKYLKQLQALALDRSGASSERGALEHGGLESTVSIPVVWLVDGDNDHKPSGRVSRVRIRVAPNASGRVSVGVSEEFAKGAGEQWRAATWLAAYNASRACGASLTDFEFSIHVDGHVDGPSASLFTAVAMLALMRGDPLRKDTTLTGSINPDGTAGPVGGIVEKIQAASDEHLSRFGFPVGMRNHRRSGTKDDYVDLMSEAGRLGLEAKELVDLKDAYEFATGVSLSRGLPLIEAELAVEKHTQELLLAKVQLAKARVETRYNELKETVARSSALAKRTVMPLEGTISSLREQAKQFERNDYQAAALEKYFDAAALMALSAKLTDVVEYWTQGKTEALEHLFDSELAVRSEVSATERQLQVRTRSSSRAGQLSSAYRFDGLIKARAALAVAEELHKKVGSNQTRPRTSLDENLLLGFFFAIQTRELLSYSHDIQDIIQDELGGEPLQADQLDRYVSGFASAATAVLDAFENMVVTRDASVSTAVDKRQATVKRSAEELKEQRKDRDRDYAMALAALQAAENGRSDQTEGRALMRLAAARFSFFTGAMLLNKSQLGAVPKEGVAGTANAGDLTITNRKALSAQLDLGRIKALEAAGRAKAQANFIPTAARISFQLASAYRDGSDTDKLNALHHYWSAIFWSELAASQSPTSAVQNCQSPL